MTTPCKKPNGPPNVGKRLANRWLRAYMFGGPLLQIDTPPRRRTVLRLGIIEENLRCRRFHDYSLRRMIHGTAKGGWR